jgi:hypothetical protein
MVRSHILVHGFVVVQTRMPLPGVKTASQWAAEFANKSMICDSKVPKFEGKANKMRKA